LFGTPHGALLLATIAIALSSNLAAAQQAPQPTEWAKMPAAK
jgi:hypothetical protein